MLSWRPAKENGHGGCRECLPDAGKNCSFPAWALDCAGRLEEIVNICFWLGARSREDARRQAVAEAAAAWLRRLGK